MAMSAKWATICKVTTEFEQFDLTSNQLDRLLENEILHGRKLHHFNGKGVEEAPQTRASIL